MLSEEIWVKLEDLPYEVSSYGRVRNLTGKVLKTYIQNCGYEQVKLMNKHKQIHRLVAMCFIDNPEHKKYVNHIDGNKLNNNVSNLEWCTNSENIIHARKTGLNPYNKPTLGKKLPCRGAAQKASKYFGVAWDKSRNKWRACVVWNNKKYIQKRFDSEIEAAKARDECVIQNNLPLPLNFSKS